MKRFEKYDKVIYDANIIIYYCFMFGNYQIINLTNKSRELTHFLTKKGFKIITSQLTMGEIKNKGATKIICDYVLANQIENFPRKRNHSLIARLQYKFENNLKKLENKKWFDIYNFQLNDENRKPLEDFFLSIDENTLEKFLKNKDRNTPVPAEGDLLLMAFSKKIRSPIVSNDKDFTFFANELYMQNLTSEIISFESLPFIYQ